MKTLIEEYEKIKKEREEFDKSLDSFISKYVDLCVYYGKLPRVSYDFDMDKKVLKIVKSEEDFTNCHTISISSKFGFEIITEFNSSFYLKYGTVFCDEIINLGIAIRQLDENLINEI